MTKESVKQSLKQILADRPFLVLLAGLILTGLIYVLVIGFSIHPRDIQVYTRYTVFGEAHFYKNPWQYTLLFVAFGAMVAAFHAAIMVKLYGLGRRQAAVVVAWVGLAILVIGAVYALSIMRLAFR